MIFSPGDRNKLNIYQYIIVISLQTIFRKIDLEKDIKKTYKNIEVYRGVRIFTNLFCCLTSNHNRMI